MANIKIKILVNHVQNKYKDKSYKEISPFVMRNYLIKEFKATKYMAQQAIKILYEYED